ncbi:MAG TPA: hypothetical protein VJS38_18045 [Phenylobacterium sp.]|uniref:hypothetical protein n=1 Tax=Phenylobacterium sp. TaxID=1871053 RepID=UPI002B4911AE|nr:hypothetical protein [Phenylobacterium sp.]HKR90074.1 hypothetical protein [Phenylobacterium sp.]
MALKISVVPVGNGWAVRSTVFENEMLFVAGAKAEAAARALARRYAARGESAEVSIFLRDGSVAGRFLHAASPDHLDAIPA